MDYAVSGSYKGYDYGLSGNVTNYALEKGGKYVWNKAKQAYDWVTMRRKRKSNGGGRAVGTSKRRRTNGAHRVRKDFQASTGGAGVMRSGFRRKRRLGRRAYKRKLFNASSDQFKFRSVLSSVATDLTPVNIRQGNVQILRMVTDNTTTGFWEINGGLVPRHDTGTAGFGNGDLFIRGGLASITVYCGGAVPLTLTIWKIHTKADANLTMFPSAVQMGWEPSLPTFGVAVDAAGATEDPWRQYSFWGAETVILQPGQTFTRTAPLKTGKISKRQWLTGLNRDYWMYMISDMDDGVASSVTILRTHNLSFTGDRTV